MDKDQEKNERVKRCIEKINQALRDESCTMEPSIQFIGDKRIVSQVLVIAIDLPDIKSGEEEKKEEIKSEEKEVN